MKLKIILGALLLIAGFLVVRLGLFFKHSVQTATTANIGNQIAGVNETNWSAVDTDSDGIPDANEAYYRTDPFNSDTDSDGYLDGEEIISGFNPTRKENPTERNKQTGNLTNSLVQHIATGIYTGDLSPKIGESQYEKNLNLLTLGTINEAIDLLNPPLISDASLVIVGKSKQSQEEYLTNTASLLEGPFLNSFMQQGQVLSQAANFMVGFKYTEATEIFKNYYLTFTNAHNQLLTVSVPENWVNFHRHLLAIFQKMALNYRSLTQIANDPLLAITALQNIPNNLLEIDSSLIQELRILIQKENLEIPNSSLFDVLDLLNTNKTRDN
ncbi:MAG: hypothetical protein HYX20_03915 [Candidatus Yanofskybacteria bacterium]|nr:hypothetical protein [Candidatus Yanofskybacteria bacterium]